MGRWLVLFHRIPPRPVYLRAKIRQRLAAAGAVALKNAVYLLPQNAEALEDLQWIAQEIAAGGGEAHLVDGDFLDHAATTAALAQFHEARNSDYAALAGDAREALKSARSSRAAATLGNTLAALRARLDAIGRIDFFDSSGRAAAEEAIAAIEKRLRKESIEETRMAKANPDLRGRTWVTRPGVKVDRMASAWFILRFIDPKARFRFAEPASPRLEGEIRFDMVGADFTHEKDRCTLETLVARIGLPDKGVGAIAEIVHDLDLKDGRFDRPETTGVRAMLEGLMARSADDQERIERALPLFDDLREAFMRPRRGAARPRARRPSR
jgi:hypothetical protein